MFKKPQIAVFATADIPLYQYMNGTQIATQYLVTGGISYNFQLKKAKEVEEIEHTEDGPVVYREETFKVWGICGMCKKTIESTLNAMDGVAFAQWDQQKQSLKIRFDSLKLSLEEIKQELADVGYDTETHKATQAAYDNLHECCKYERN
jgi:copper chaperone CopZ